MNRQHLKIALITLGVHTLYLFMLPTSLKIKEPPIKKQELKVITKELPHPRAQTIQMAPSDKNAPTEPTRSFIPRTPPPKKTPPPVTTKTVKTMRGKLEKNVAKIQKKTPAKTLAKTYPKSPSKTPQKSLQNSPSKSSIKPTKPSTKNSLPQHLPPSFLITKADKTMTSMQEGPEDIKLSYLETISSQLRQWLTLPEKGAVKLTITVQANGKIGNIKPVSHESEKNLEYLVLVLEAIQLPVFGKNEEITFTITFCDD